MDRYNVYTDGACHNGVAEAVMGIGFAVYTADGKLALEGAKCLGYGTSNSAEYLAFQQALQFLMGRAGAEFMFYSDSQVLVNQVNGDWAVKYQNLIGYHSRVKGLIAEMGAQFLGLQWIPREKNKQADKMSKAGIGLYQGGAGIGQKKIFWYITKF